MPSGKKNWTYKDVSKVLRANGFWWNKGRKAKTGHRFYVHDDGRIVTVPYHGSNTQIAPKTVTSMISQSGLSEKDWGIKPKKKKKAA